MTPYLQHYGVKGMKWGVRRYRNKDGSLTPAGQKRYAKKIKQFSNKKTYEDQLKSIEKDPELKKDLKKAAKSLAKAKKEWYDLDEEAETVYQKDYQTAHNKATEYAKKHWKEMSFDGKPEQGNRWYDTWVEGLTDEFYIETSTKAIKATKAADDAYKRYSEQLNKTVDSIVGSYGNMRVKTIQGPFVNNDRVRDVVDNIINRLVSEELKPRKNT